MTSNVKHILSLFSLLLMAATAAAEPPKNTVLILADDLGWADTMLYGKTSLYETPNIQRHAARGMTFSSAYASPICSPTRASIMTGQNPARHGMTAPAAHLEIERFEAVVSENGPPHQKSTNVRSATRLDPNLSMLGQVLKDAGYSTAHFGKWHLGREPHSPLERGFDVDIPHWWGPGPKSSYLAPWGYTNPMFKEGKSGEHIEDRMAKEAVAWLKNRDRSKPFFMNYWQFSVHAPFGAKPELIDYYRKKLGDSVAGLSEPRVREKLLASHKPATGLPQQSPTYAAMVHSLDDAVGNLLDALDEEGIADETLIVFYSDNGGNIHCGLEETAASGGKYITPITSNHPLRGGKGGIHEGGVRVPAVVVWPGVTRPGSRNDTRIHATDLYPTILRMLNVDRPKDHPIDGVDFAKALRGEKIDRGPMFTHVPGHGGTPHWLPPSMSVHHGDWKLIRSFYYGEDGKHEYRLYNLREDIGENRNLAAAHPEKVKELDKLIEDYIAEAKVVVPLPNPNFDLAKFDSSKIGVQPGGLKMPPSFKSSRPKPGAGEPSKPAKQKSVLGWTAKNAQATVNGESLQISPSGRQPFIACAKVRANGPIEVRLRIKTQKNGTGRLQWRTEGQDGFPETGQRKSFEIDGGDWRELTVPLPVEGRAIHVRLFMPDAKRPTEIDWIEIGAKDGKAKDRQRWDFKQVEQRPSKAVSNTSNGARPNVILIYTDDHGYTDLGVLGIDKQVDTPNMDKLARGGALMTAGYSSAPQCQPSRAGLMVGRVQNEFAFPHNACDAGEGKGRMPRTYPNGTDMAGEPVLTIADRMKKLGYITGFSGKWHLGPTNSSKPKHDPRGRGFDYYWTGTMNSGSTNLTLDGKPAEHQHRKGLPKGVANRVILQGKYGESFIDLSQAGDKPFFLYLPLFGPHIPLIEKSDPYYKNFAELDYPHYDDWRDDRRRMGLALIKSIDDVVGGVMAKLREHGLEENTLVLFASDNGAPSKMGRNDPGLPGGPPGTKGGVWNGSNNVPMRGEKGSLFEGGIRVPMFAYWKGKIMPGTVIEEMVTTLDLTATTLKVGGGAIPDEFDGVDLLPRLTGIAGKIDRPKPMFWEFWQTQAVRVGDWKLWRSNTEELLFNLAQDPYELTNRAQSDPEVAARLRNLLDQWSASLPRLGEPQQDASEVFAWPLSGAPKGAKPDPRYRVPYIDPKPAPYPAPIQRAPVE